MIAMLSMSVALDYLLALLMVGGVGMYLMLPKPPQRRDAVRQPDPRRREKP